MTINDLDAFVHSLPDWSILNGCFGTTRIRPTDIDGCVERRGTCLFLEHKGPGGKVGGAQDGLFRALAAQGNAVIVYWTGTSLEDVTDVRVYWKDTVYNRAADLESFKGLVTRWFLRANSEP